MTTITIELPEALSQRLNDQGISPDQLNETATRLVLLYIQQQLLSSADAPATSSSPTQVPSRPASIQKNLTLLDLRGAVPVSAPQNFEAVRQQVRITKARQIARD